MDAEEFLKSDETVIYSNEASIGAWWSERAIIQASIHCIL